MLPSLSLALALSCSSAPSGDGSAPSAAAPEVDARPDIVVVLVDTLRADHVGAYGYQRPTTPHIDAWASGAAVFERAYAHSGWTLASVASLLTGRLPHQHRTGRSPDDASVFCSLPDDVPTLAEQLLGAGYRTGAFINNTFLAPQFGLNRGFSHWDWQGSSPTEIRSAADTVDAALAWLAEDRAQPTFAVVHMMEPHALYQPSAPFLGTFSDATPVPEGQGIDEATIVRWQTYQALPTPEQRARAVALYDEEILAVDAAVGTLLDGLKARDSGRGTVVVFTADHGEEFWDHSGFEHGQSLMGELTRVPLIVAGPDVPTGRFSTVVGHTDLTRSIQRVAGLQPDPGGDLLAIAAVGPYAGPRLSVSENTLYGPPRVSVVDDEHRLDVRQDTQHASLWKVAADRSERERVMGPDAAEQGRALHSQLLQVRGDTQPLASMQSGTCGTAIADYSVFQQLEALGYLDVRPDVPVDQPAAGASPE